MINLEKEIQEAFEEMAHKMGMCLDQYWGDGYDNPYENDDTHLAYNIFRDGAKSKQAEITELKQKLEKLESGEFVLLSKPSVRSIVLDEDTINLDDEITKLSSDFSEKCFLDGEQEEDIEMLIAKSMKLGELYERKRWQQVIIEAEPSI